jgi:hypothetical protein
MAQEKTKYDFEGRPTKYKEEYCKMLEDHMAQGLSFESFAGTIRVHRETLYEWCNVHREFSDSKKRGVELSLAWHEKVFNAMALGKIKNGNSTALLFMMKNRHRWRDNPPDSHNQDEAYPEL